MTHTPRHISHPGESGNVMLYIFLGIALFAALSFAVSNIMRSGTADPRKETRMLEATDIIQYGDGLKRTVQGLRVRGVNDNQISFETPRLTGYDHPVAAPSRCITDSCRVFARSGGGFTYIPPTDRWLDSAHSTEPTYGEWFFPTGTCVEDSGSGGAGCNGDATDNEELIAIMPWIKQDLCIEINDRLGVTNPGGMPPVAGGNAWPVSNARFVGTYTEDSVIARGGDTAGCLRGAGSPPSNSYFYYKVLLAR